MTQNVSNNGVRFETARTYKLGETVRAKIPWGEWAKTGEILGRVVRVDCPAEAPSEASNGVVPPAGSNDTSPALTSVAVAWMNAERNGNAAATKPSKIGSH